VTLDEVAAGGHALRIRTSGPLLVREGDRIIMPEGSPLRAKLTVEAVAEQEIRRSLVLPAIVEADPSRLVKVLPPLAGRITQLKVQLGERVKEGQPLAILDSPDLGTAYADHERATVLVELARKNRDRARDLSKIGGAAVRELQQAETDYVTADVEHHRADARLKQIGVNPETTDPSKTLTITAPIAGSVIELDVGAGAFWNDPNASLLTVADLSSVWVTANVPEKDTALVAKGQPVEVVFAAYPNEAFKGEILFVSDVLDADTRRTKVRIAFPNPGIRLKPNMFANVNFLAAPQMVALAVHPESGPARGRRVDRRRRFASRDGRSACARGRHDWTKQGCAAAPAGSRDEARAATGRARGRRLPSGHLGGDGVGGRKCLLEGLVELVFAPIPGLIGLGLRVGRLGSVVPRHPPG
jgi:cobalt-zinc-cadmium efflux system membrane fusion protein